VNGHAFCLSLLHYSLRFVSLLSIILPSTSNVLLVPLEYRRHPVVAKLLHTSSPLLSAALIICSGTAVCPIAASDPDPTSVAFVQVHYISGNRRFLTGPVIKVAAEAVAVTAAVHAIAA
jgi:hypothetical protein